MDQCDLESQAEWVTRTDGCHVVLAVAWDSRLSKACLPRAPVRVRISPNPEDIQISVHSQILRVSVRGEDEGYLRLGTDALKFST